VPLDEDTLERSGNVTATAITHQLQDAFGRTVNSGWGRADSGHSWTVTGGSPADYRVEGA
jgi:hypothetical protein